MLHDEAFDLPVARVEGAASNPSNVLLPLDGAGRFGQASGDQGESVLHRISGIEQGCAKATCGCVSVLVIEKRNRFCTGLFFCEHQSGWKAAGIYVAHEGSHTLYEFSVRRITAWGESKASGRAMDRFVDRAAQVFFVQLVEQFRQSSAG